MSLPYAKKTLEDLITKYVDPDHATWMIEKKYPSDIIYRLIRKMFMVTCLEEEQEFVREVAHNIEKYNDYRWDVKEYDLIQPSALENPNWSKLVANLDCYLTNLGTDDEREDDEYFIYEDVMMTIYGPNIFNFINKRSRRR